MNTTYPVRTGERQFQSTWQYNGLTTTATDRLGRVTRMIVDPTNLTSSTDWLDNLSGPVIETYATANNADGTLRSTSNSLGQISFTYDTLGRTDLLLQDITFVGSSVPTIALDYDHNELNQRTQTVFRLGGVDQLTERFFYDSAGRVRAIDQTGPAVTDTSAEKSNGSRNQMGQTSFRDDDKQRGLTQYCTARELL